MPLAPGTKLGRYEIVALIGRGGMGEVYRARDTRLPRDVAIKVLSRGGAAPGDSMARFEREAFAVAALSHPNIVAIHDFGTQDGLPFAVTELLDGEPLRDLLRGGPLPVQRAVAFGVQIARAVQAAHARAIVHRDLKPENIFVLAGDHLKILDFGLARAPAESPSTELSEAPTAVGLTNAGTMLGTAGYMAPEQIRAGAIDHRADVFAIGCVMYEMLSGRRAFTGDGYVDILHATLHSTPRGLDDVDVPDGLGLIVKRCLAKSPGDRFQTATDLLFALDTFGTPGKSEARLATGTGGLALSNTSDTPLRGIAILPFENLGAEDQGYFAAGITEEVTLQLSKVRALRIMSRNAVARFPDGARQLPEMARELDIAAAVAGTVRRAGLQVRVGVQLLAAPTGETIWAEQYDRHLSDVFEVQSDIALRVTRALQAALPSEERVRIERLPTANPAAYDVYLRQKSLNVLKPVENATAVDLLHEALALDPTFALAHVALARRLTFRGYVTGRIDTLRALDAARTAVALDPQLARAHYALANAHSSLGQADAARLSMQRAIELDGNLWEAMVDLALLELDLGHVDQAFYWATRGWPLAPNIPNTYYHLSLPLVLLDDRLAERMLLAAEGRFDGTAPGKDRLALVLALIDFRRGAASRAVDRLRLAVAAYPDFEEGRLLLMELAAYAGTADAAALVDEGLAKGGGSARLWWSPYTRRALRAFLWMREGAADRARPVIDEAWASNRAAIEGGFQGMDPHYEAAALYLMGGNRDGALDALDRAVAAGFREAEFLRRDPLLAALASEPRFEAAVARINASLGEMRGRVDLGRIKTWVDVNS